MLAFAQLDLAGRSFVTAIDRIFVGAMQAADPSREDQFSTLRFFHLVGEHASPLGITANGVAVAAKAYEQNQRGQKTLDYEPGLLLLVRNLLHECRAVNNGNVLFSVRDGCLVVRSISPDPRSEAFGRFLIQALQERIPAPSDRGPLTPSQARRSLVRFLQGVDAVDREHPAQFGAMAAAALTCFEEIEPYDADGDVITCQKIRYKNP